MKALLYSDWVGIKQPLPFILLFYLVGISGSSSLATILMVVWTVIFALSPFFLANRNSNWLVYSQMLPISARERVFRRYIYTFAVFLPFPLIRLLALFPLSRVAPEYLSIGLPTAFLLVLFSLCLPFAFLLQEELDYWQTLGLTLLVAGVSWVVYHVVLLNLPLTDLALAWGVVAIGAVCFLVSIPVSIRFCQRWS